MALKISPSPEGNRSQKGAGGGRSGVRYCLQGARWCLQPRSKNSAAEYREQGWDASLTYLSPGFNPCARNQQYQRTDYYNEREIKGRENSHKLVSIKFWELAQVQIQPWPNYWHSQIVVQGIFQESKANTYKWNKTKWKPKQNPGN